MRRAVMTIHAVHAADFELRRIVLEILRAILGNFALRIGATHPGDRHVLVVGRDVLDLVVDVHVPVNAARWAIGRITATYIH